MFRLEVTGNTPDELRSQLLDLAALLGGTAIGSGTVKVPVETKVEAKADTKTLDAAKASQIAGSAATVVPPKAGKTADQIKADADKVRATEAAKARAIADEKKLLEDKAAEEARLADEAAANEATRLEAVETGATEVDPLATTTEAEATDEQSFTHDDARDALMELRALVPQADQTKVLSEIVTKEGNAAKLLDVAPANFGKIVQRCRAEIAKRAA